jgi:hypothetical protein
MQRNLFVALTIVVAIGVLLAVIPAIAHDDDDHNNGNNSDQDNNHKGGNDKGGNDKGGTAGLQGPTGPQGPPGPTGPQGPTGPAGTTGQGIAVTQATPVVLNAGQTVTIATLSVTVTSSSGGILLISSYGGITSSQQPGGPGSIMDIGVLINGSPLGNPSQRITIVPNSTLPQGTTPQGQVESWGFTGSSGIVEPGTYTINLVVQHVSGPPIFVGSNLGGSGPFTPGVGQLQAVVINK